MDRDPNGMNILGSAVLSFDAVEEVCESRQTTLVIHPAIRRAIKGYEESFYVGLRCILAGETDGLYFLPLEGAGYVRLIFSRLTTSNAILLPAPCRTSTAGVSASAPRPTARDAVTGFVRRLRQIMGEACRTSCFRVSSSIARGLQFKQFGVAPA
jgi:hypothetical protein